MKTFSKIIRTVLTYCRKSHIFKEIKTSFLDMETNTTVHFTFLQDKKTLNQNQSEKLEKLKVDSSVSGCLTEAIGRGGSSSEYLKMLKKNEEITGNIEDLNLAKKEFKKYN